jgi:hypothetical protein
MSILGRNNKKGVAPQAQTVPPVTRQPARKQANYIDLISNVTRMPQMADPRAIGPTFFTADQADQRVYLGAGYDGRDAYNADRGSRPVVQNGYAPGFANVARVKRHPDGTCDSVRLDATGDGWIDYGGKTPSDFKVVNW